MSDMQAALDAARTRLINGGNTAPTLTPTPDTTSRYSAPIATAQSSGLPIIDISPFMDFLSSPAARKETAQAINAACINYGFFYLTGHGIPIADLDEVISLARQFFALPLEQKNRIKRYDAGGPEGGDGARGYQGLGENVTGGLQDMQEAIDWYAEWPTAKKEVGDGGPGSVKTLQGENLWPEEPAGMKDVYLRYVERVKEVGRAVVHAMGVALELGPVGQDDDGEDEEVFVRACQDSFWVMRTICYPPLPASVSLSKSSTSTATSTTNTTSTQQEQPPPNANAEEEEPPSAFSCGAHTDYGCITLLLADPTPHSLQILLKNSTWLPASPLPGAFIVNIGDMIERWTNGLWKSTLHRVIHRGDGNGEGGNRISVPFFFEPGFESVVRPLGKCVERTGGGRRWVEGEGEGTYGEHLLTKVFSNFYFSKRTEW